jgi:hypothetical protein
MTRHFQIRSVATGKQSFREHYLRRGFASNLPQSKPHPHQSSGSQSPYSWLRISPVRDRLRQLPQVIQTTPRSHGREGVAERLGHGLSPARRGDHKAFEKFLALCKGEQRSHVLELAELKSCVCMQQEDAGRCPACISPAFAFVEEPLDERGHGKIYLHVQGTSHLQPGR